MTVYMYIYIYIYIHMYIYMIYKIYRIDRIYSICLKKNIVQLFSPLTLFFEFVF